MTTSEVLRGVRERLTSERWFQFKDHGPDPENQECVLMAITKVCGDNHRETEIILSQLISGNSDVIHRRGRIARWNDSSNTTLQDVHAALDAAITIEEGKHEYANQ